MCCMVTMGACPCSLTTPLPSHTMTRVPWRITTWQQPSGSCRSPSIASWRQVAAMQGAACQQPHLHVQHLQPSKAALHQMDRQLTPVAEVQQPICWLTATHLQGLQAPTQLWVNVSALGAPSQHGACLVWLTKEPLAGVLLCQSAELAAATWPPACCSSESEHLPANRQHAV